MEPCGYNEESLATKMKALRVAYTKRICMAGVLLCALGITTGYFVESQGAHFPVVACLVGLITLLAFNIDKMYPLPARLPHVLP